MLYRFALAACLISFAAVQAQTTLPPVCNVYNFYRRSQWNQYTPLSVIPSQEPFPYVVVHETDGPTCTDFSSCTTVVQSIQTADVRSGKTDIGVNLIITPFGDIYSARSWDAQGQHTPGYDLKAVGIAVIGSYATAAPSDAVITALGNVLSCGKLIGKVQSNYTLYYCGIGKAFVRALSKSSLPKATSVC
jgi:hypothetical protein